MHHDDKLMFFTSLISVYNATSDQYMYFKQISICD